MLGYLDGAGGLIMGNAGNGASVRPNTLRYRVYRGMLNMEDVGSVTASSGSAFEMLPSRSTRDKSLPARARCLFRNSRDKNV